MLQRHARRSQVQGTAKGLRAKALIQTVTAQQKRIARVNIQLQHLQRQLWGGTNRAGQGLGRRMGTGLIAADVLRVDQLLLQ
ncbi:hypothetical protein D3C78_1402860 [compost metagenome]